MNHGDALRVLRGLLLALVVFGICGATIELYLLEHTERWQQLIPFVVLALGLVAAAAFAIRQRRATTIAFRAAMALFVAAGLLGIYLHYRGNVEFELERNPALGGRALIWKTLTGATPVGAPGFLVQLGLLGLALTYRHPALDRSPDSTPPDRRY